MTSLRPALEADRPAPAPRIAAAGLAVLAVGAAAATSLDGPAASVGWLLGAALLGAAVAARSPVAALAALLLASSLQNLVAAPLAGALSASAVVALLLGKEVFAAGAGLWGNLRSRAAGPWLPGDAVAGIYLLALVVVAARDLLSGMPVGQGWLAAFRQAVTLPFLWFVGRGLSARTHDESEAVIGWVLRVGLLVALFGLVERFVLGDGLWLAVGLKDLYMKKGLGTFYWDAHLPANFWSYYHGHEIRRLAGPLGEPTSTAHFLALPAALLLGARLSGGPPSRAAPLLALGIGAALLLTLGKSGIAVALLGAGAALWKAHPGARKVLLVLGAAGVAAVLAAVRFTPGLAENVAVHLGGLRVLAGISPLGGGFGTAGNLALAIRGGGPSGDLAAESFVAVLGAQAGLAGVGGFFLFVIGAAATLLYARGPGADARAVLGGLVLATGLAAIGSETPAGFIGGGTAFLVAGALARSLVAAARPSRVHLSAANPDGRSQPDQAALSREARVGP